MGLLSNSVAVCCRVLLCVAVSATHCNTLQHTATTALISHSRVLLPVGCRQVACVQLLQNVDHERYVEYVVLVQNVFYWSSCCLPCQQRSWYEVDRFLECELCSDM